MFPLALLLLAPPAAASDFTDAVAGAFTCCSDAHVQSTVEGGLLLQERLIDEPEASHSAQTYVLYRRLQGLSRTSVGGAEEPVLSETLAAVEAVKDGTRDELLEAWPAISRGLIHLALRHPGGSLELAEARCSATGRVWLYRRVELASPWGDTCAAWR